MMTKMNIIKKGLSFCFIGAFACLLFASEVKAESCPSYCTEQTVTKNNKNECQKCANNNVSKLAGQGKSGCLLTVPMQPSSAGNISALPGYRYRGEGKNNYHEGMDIGTAGKPGIKALAAAAGKATYTTSYGGSWHTVMIKHKLSANENYSSGDCQEYETRYLHLYQAYVKTGQEVAQGYPVGEVGGSNCNSKGCFQACNDNRTPQQYRKCDAGFGYSIHLHYEVRNCKGKYMNPLSQDAQGLCDGVSQSKVDPNNVDLSEYKGPGSDNVENPYLSQKQDCSKKTTEADKKECEIRNKKIDNREWYCPPGKGYNKKQETTSAAKDDGKCNITKTATKARVNDAITAAINKASTETGLPATLIAAFIQTESSFKSGQVSGAGAGGYTQIMPNTWDNLVDLGLCQGPKTSQPGGNAARLNGTNNITCGANYYKYLLEGCPSKSGKLSCSYIKGDPLKAIAAYNSGPYAGCPNKKNPNGVCKYSKSNWKELIPAETKGYIVKLPKFQEQLANNNNCSTSALGGTGGTDMSGCEDFTRKYGEGGSGSGIGGSFGTDAYGVAEFESNYKCNISENYSSLKGCLFCKLFEVVFNASSQIVAKSHVLFSESMVMLLSVGLAIALAWIIMQHMADMARGNPGMLLNAILRKTMLIAFLILLLKVDVVNLFNMFVTPIFEAGFNLAETIIRNSSTQLATDTPWDKLDGSGLPAAIGYSMLKAIYAVQARLEQLMALGSNSICIAFYVKSYHGWPIFPHFGYLITGVFLWVIAVVFILAYPFLLIDSVLQFTIATSLLPVAIAATGFKLTYKYLNIFKVINIFMTAMFVFIFLTIVLFIILAGLDKELIGVIRRAYDETSQSNYFSLSELGWFALTFIKLVFFLFLGKTVLDDIPSFAEDYAKAASGGESGGKADMKIGRQVGTYLGQGALGAAKLGAKAAAPVVTGAKDLAGEGLRTAGRYVASRAVTGRQNYLIKHTMKKAAATTGSTGLNTAITGRNWWGQKVTRTVKQNADGSYTLESSRKSLFRRRDIVKLEDKNISIRKKISKDGTTKELYKMNSSLARTLINVDGTINQKVLKELRQNTNIPKEEVNKAILHQLMKQRIPDAGAKIGFKWGWPPISRTASSLEGTFVSEQIKSYTDKKGNEIFEVRRVGKDGNTNVFKMTEGKERTLVEYERITKNGKSKKLLSDGILQMKESGQYELNSDGTIKNELNVDSQVLINGAEVKNAQISTNGTIKDASGKILGKIQANGNIVDSTGKIVGTATVPDLIFDATGKALGKMTAEGTVVDDSGNIKGMVADNGAVLDTYGRQIGHVPPEQRNALMEGIKPKYKRSKVEFSHSRAYKGIKIFDEDGHLMDGMKKEELMFDDDSIALYQRQMKLYGDVLNHHQFGK